MMPGVKKMVNSASIRKKRPPQTRRLSPYAMPIVTARLRNVPTNVIVALTLIARLTTPPAKTARYASRLGCSGQMTRPPFWMTSASLARLVATTARNGYTTNTTITPKTHNLTTLVRLLSFSSQAGRSPVTRLDTRASSPEAGDARSSRYRGADGCLTLAGTWDGGDEQTTTRRRIFHQGTEHRR